MNACSEAGTQVIAVGLMFGVPYTARLSISGPDRGNLTEEIGCLIGKCVVRGEGGGHLHHNDRGCGPSTEQQKCARIQVQ